MRVGHFMEETRVKYKDKPIVSPNKSIIKGLKVHIQKKYCNGSDGGLDLPPLRERGVTPLV